MTRSPRAMGRAAKRRDGGQQGASLVEFAITVTVLLLVLAGALDVGRAFNAYIILMNAGREGVRYASHFPHLGDQIREATIQEAAQSGLVLEDEDITVIPEPPGGALPDDLGVAQPGDTIEVQIQYDLSEYMTGVFGFLPMVRTRAEMVVFGQD